MFTLAINQEEVWLSSHPVGDTSFYIPQLASVCDIPVRTWRVHLFLVWKQFCKFLAEGHFENRC